MKIRIFCFGLFVSAWITPSFTQQSDGCYKKYENQRVDCLQPYKSQTVSSDQECEGFCTKNLPGCKAAQYATDSNMCGLYNIALPVYAVGGRRRRGSYTQPPKTYGVPCTGYGPAVKYAQGYCYLVPTGQYCAPPADPDPAPALVPAPAPAPPPPPPPPPPPSPSPPPLPPATTLADPTTTPIPKVPSDAACPAGQVVRYFAVDGYQLPGEPDFTTTTDKEQGCRDACTNNRLPDGKAAPCRSADYNAQTKQCLISLQAFPPLGSKTPQKNANFKHYEKVCVDASTGAKCQGPFFRARQMILVGFAQAVANASSAGDCLQQCVDSQSRFGFGCGSAMYYYQELHSNCILNSETRIRRPDLFKPEPNDTVDYMEPGCTTAAANRTGRLHKRQTATAGKRNRDILRPKVLKYGGWSMCDRKYLVHRRYKQCPGMNPSRCVKTEASCDPSKEALYDEDTPPPYSITGPPATIATKSPGLAVSTPAPTPAPGSAPVRPGPSSALGSGPSPASGPVPIGAAVSTLPPLSSQPPLSSSVPLVSALPPAPVPLSVSAPGGAATEVPHSSVAAASTRSPPTTATTQAIDVVDLPAPPSPASSVPNPTDANTTQPEAVQILVSDTGDVVADDKNFTRNFTRPSSGPAFPSSAATSMAWRHDFDGPFSSTPPASTTTEHLPSWPKKQLPARVDVCEPLLNLDGTKSCKSGLKISLDGKRYWCTPSQSECS